MSQLIGTSGTIEGAQRILSTYLCGSVTTLNKTDKNTWSVINSKGHAIGLQIVWKKNRYRIEEVIQ